MNRNIIVLMLAGVCLAALPALGAPVVFNDSALLALVQTQYQAQVGSSLSDPPEDSELANALFVTLDASDSGITDLTGLEACTSLTTLYLPFNAITDVSALSGLTSLEVLDLGYSDPVRLPTWDPLAIDTNYLDNTDLANLSGLFNLVYLNIGGNTGITSLSTLTPANFPALEELWLGSNPITDFSPLGSITTLTSLAIAGCGITNSDMATLNNLTSLGILGLILETSLTDISGLSALNPGYVVLDACSISSIAVAATWTNLGYISANSTAITSLAGLENCSLLEEAYFADCQLTDISALNGSKAALTNLLSLDLTNNFIADISALEFLTNLAVLGLQNNLITDLQALLDNSGFNGADPDYIDIRDNPLSKYARCTQIGDLKTQMEPLGSVIENEPCAATLTVSLSGLGNVDPGFGTFLVAYDSTVYLFAYPTDSSGYAFQEWTGDVTSTNPAIQVVMDTDKAVEAVFVEAGYSLNLTIDGTGVGTVNPWGAAGIYNYLSGRNVALQAVPDSGNYFGGWSGDLTGYSLDEVLPMTGNKSVTATFSSTGYSLTINAPTGNGSTDPGAGSYDLAEGATPLISATPDAGWVFDHWEGDIGTADANDPDLVVTMDQARAVTPVFTEGLTYDLTVSVTGNGSTNPSGTTSYSDGTAVNVLAIAGAGAAFDHWEGDIGSANSTANPLNVTMDQDRAVTAVFVDADWELTIVVNGSGTTLPGAGTYGYMDGETLFVEATPDNSTVAFDHWEGDIGDADPYSTGLSLTMDQDRSVTAVFAAADFTLDILATGPGTTLPEPGTYGFLSGRSLYVYASPDAGKFFGGWSGDLTSVVQGETIVMDESKSITAAFSDTGYTITLAATANGTTDPAPGTYALAEGLEFAASAIATDFDWRFAEWQGDIGFADPYNSEISVLVDSDRSLTAVFEEIPEWNLSITVVGEGHTNPLEGTVYTYTDGEVVTITATPSTGWLFSEWSGQISGADPSSSSIMVTMNQDRAITATFSEIPDYTVVLAATGQGTTSPEPGTYTHQQGAVVDFIAIPDSGAEFLGWSGNIGSEDPSDPTISVTITSNRTITANFTPLPDLTLTIAAQGNGTTDPAPGSYDYEQGTIVDLEALPNEGATFEGWTGDIGDADPNSATISVTMDVNRSVTAVFSAVPEYSLDLRATGNGTTNPTPGVYTYEEDTEVQLTAVADSEATFLGWTGDIGAADPSSTTISVTMDADKTITATFSVSTHDADQNGDGLISLSELLRVIQFFNSNGYHCDAAGEDGFNPGPGDQTCAPHSSDYNSQDWLINLSELLRLIQFFNSNGYYACPGEGTEDGFCVGPDPNL